MCVSTRPISKGPPACLMEEMGDAPVPPSWPLIWMMSAFALATPDATVPMPACATNFTLTLADGAACRYARICSTQVHATFAHSAPSDWTEVRSIEEHRPGQALLWPSKFLHV